MKFIVEKTKIGVNGCGAKVAPLSNWAVSNSVRPNIPAGFGVGIFQHRTTGLGTNRMSQSAQSFFLLLSCLFLSVSLPSLLISSIFAHLPSIRFLSFLSYLLYFFFLCIFPPSLPFHIIDRALSFSFSGHIFVYVWVTFTNVLMKG